VGDETASPAARREGLVVRRHRPALAAGKPRRRDAIVAIAVLVGYE